MIQTHSKYSAFLNKLLQAIVLVALLVIGLVVYTSFGGSKVNLSNTFLPYYGELLGYGVSPNYSNKIKLININRNESAFDLSQNSEIFITRSLDNTKVLINSYSDNSSTPQESQVWNLIKSSKESTLADNSYWFLNGENLKYVEFNQNIPAFIKDSASSFKVTLEEFKIEDNLKQLTLTTVKYWPENNQLWALFQRDNNMSEAVVWNASTGDVIGNFKLPASKTIFFGENEEAAIFVSKDSLNMLSYNSKGLEIFNKSSSEKISSMHNFNGQNYVITEVEEKVAVNLSKLSNIDRKAYKVQVWDKDFLNLKNTIKTEHTMPITVFNPISNTNYILSAGKDGMVTIIDLDKSSTIEQYPVDINRKETSVEGGYLDYLSNQLILIYKNGDLNFYQLWKI